MGGDCTRVGQPGIKETGAHEVTVKLHHDVTAKFTVNVKAMGGEEAEGAKGEAKAEEKDEKGYKAKVKARHQK